MTNRLPDTKNTIEIKALHTLYEIYISLLKEEKYQLSSVIESALYKLENELSAEMGREYSDEVENIFKQFQVISGFCKLPESSRKKFVNKICSSIEEPKGLCRFE